MKPELTGRTEEQATSAPDRSSRIAVFFRSLASFLWQVISRQASHSTMPQRTPSLEAFISRIAPKDEDLPDPLPLVHNTKAEYLDSIIRVSSLIPRMWNVFHEDLLYLFYGRPAYRVSKGRLPSTEPAYCPVCFVLKPPSIDSGGCRLYPFDTGAAKSGMFLPHIQPEFLAPYSLSPFINNARRIVSFFFGSNLSYYSGFARKGLTFKPSDMIVALYYKLISEHGQRSYDDRRSAIEVQVTKPIALYNSLQMVILPLSYLQQPSVRKAIFSDWQVAPRHYDFTDGTSPQEYTPIIRHILGDHLKQETVLR